MASARQEAQDPSNAMNLAVGSESDESTHLSEAVEASDESAAADQPSVAGFHPAGAESTEEMVQTGAKTGVDSAVDHDIGDTSGSNVEMKAVERMEEDQAALLKNSMLEHVSGLTEAYFKSQQKDEPDLTTAEKRKIAEDLLDKSPPTFLSRYAKYLLVEHLEYFADADDSLVQYYVEQRSNELKKSSSYSKVRLHRADVGKDVLEPARSPNRNRLANGSNSSQNPLQQEPEQFREYLIITMTIEPIKTIVDRYAHALEATVRNRRLEALKRLSEKGEYFSDKEMKRRNPLLFEELVGQFLTNDQKFEFETTGDAQPTSFAAFFMDIVEKDYADSKMMKEVEKDVSMMKTGEPSRSSSNVVLWGEMEVNPQSKQRVLNNSRLEEVTEGEKHNLLNEFRSKVFTDFLGGRDDEFDYSEVDGNTDYDDLNAMEQDQQEGYFDSESPLTVMDEDSNSSCNRIGYEFESRSQSPDTMKDEPT